MSTEQSWKKWVKNKYREQSWKKWVKNEYREQSEKKWVKNEYSTEFECRIVYALRNKEKHMDNTCRRKTNFEKNLPLKNLPLSMHSEPIEAHELCMHTITQKNIEKKLKNLPLSMHSEQIEAHELCIHTITQKKKRGKHMNDTYIR